MMLMTEVRRTLLFQWKAVFMVSGIFLGIGLSGGLSGSVSTGASYTIPAVIFSIGLIGVVAVSQSLPHSRLGRHSHSLRLRTVLLLLSRYLYLMCALYRAVLKGSWGGQVLAG